jgi:drug/metabolite transporter (DMT)-like permease
MTRPVWVAFAALSLMWGIPYLLIKVAIEDGVPPAFIAWSRVALAAAVLLPLAWHAGELRTLRGKWRWLALYGVLEIAGPFTLIATGETHLSSSLTAIIISAVPLMVAALALRFDAEERAAGRRLVGLLMGFGGVVGLVGIDIAGRADELLGAGMILVAATGYAMSAMLLKHRLSGLDLRAVMGGSLALVTVMLAPFAVADLPTKVPSQAAVLSLVVLGLVCTAAALLAVGFLVSEVGPGRAMVVAYVNPVIAVALGVLILDERPGVAAVAGLLLVLAGSWLSTDGRIPPGLAGAVTRFARARRTRR